MLILLPPSETKRDGGAGEPLALDGLGFGELSRVRREVLAAVAKLSRNREASIRALKLGPKQAGEVDRNRAIRSSATMPALERYTGVLYDALDAPSLSEESRAFAHSSLAVHSALLGLVRADDLIPAYRLSFDSRLSLERGAPTLKKRWAPVVGGLLAARPGLILDLRSEGYAALGPTPVREHVHYVRVLARDESGNTRALNHFNKQAKGLFARALVQCGIDFAGTAELLDWARSEGYDLSLSTGGPASAGGVGDLELVVPEVTGERGSLMAALR
ncbi:YaaA family protein [Leifsonia poae]|uniref:Peroxide stress protein YaaA n=1 Tax=Leifsonia poae TaxID=110933 RepID=A0A9W6HC52_9MICO|nr:peroxide stress protein YaaA [Leifsonia poae]GLJ77395.1 peroxide stress protein YaaA [Leifsonia poae]